MSGKMAPVKSSRLMKRERVRERISYGGWVDTDQFLCIILIILSVKLLTLSSKRLSSFYFQIAF